MSQLVDDFVAYINSDTSKILTSQGYPEPLCKALLAYIERSGLKRKNPQELLFTFYEGNFVPLYERLLSRDSTFLSTDQNFDLACSNYTKALIARMKMKWWSELMRILIIDPAFKPPTSLAQSLEDFRKKRNKLDAQIVEDLLREPQLSIADLQRFDFMTFLLSQMIRTQRCKNTISELANSDSRFALLSGRPEVTLCYFTHLGIHRIATTLIRAKFRLVFLVNATEENLITGDQPIVNTFADFGREDEHLEIYYPLSPKLAMLYTSRPCYSDTNEILLNAEDVKQYNRLLFEQCEDQVYCFSFDDLGKFPLTGG
jgi:putative component of membrane protein insertase Oxa1/YidC/SpoIIIJ protein YidD